MIFIKQKQNKNFINKPKNTPLCIQDDSIVGLNQYSKS